MPVYCIEIHGTGAELVCRNGSEIQRFWFPSRVKALIAKAQFEANPQIAAACAADPSRRQDPQIAAQPRCRD